MTDVGNLHDKFFKRLIGTPEIAAAFLRERLPPAIAAALAPDPPDLVPGSFVDPRLAASHADLLFRVRTKEGEAAFLYVLIEHKSRPEPLIAFQLLRYMVRIWEAWLREQTQQQGRRRREPVRLPAIVLLVLYHGASAWTVPAGFSALVPAPAALRPHQPDFSYVLSDLGQIADGALSADRRLQAGLMALKYIFRRELSERLEAMLLAQAVDFMVELLRYVTSAHRFLKEEAVRAALRRVLPEQEEAIMSTLAQQWQQRGRAEGLAAGKAEGEAIGKAAALLRILTRRFGALPEAARAEVMAADPATLDAWIDAAIDAPSLAAVLGGRQAN